MPKPRSSELKEFDVRVTPADQTKPATQWELLATGHPDERILICREGGEGTDKKLHYHGYLKTNISESHLRKQLAIIAGGTGNPHLSLRVANDGTIGYIVKDKDPVYRHNITQDVLESYFANSDAYRVKKESERKQETRKKQSVLSRISKEIKEHPPPHPSPETLYEAFEEAYNKRDMPMPSRSTLETAIVNLLPPHLKRAYYLKNLSQY